MLVGAHDGGVDHRIFVVGVLGQMIEDCFPDPASGPPAESRMHHAKVAEAFRQIAPRYPRAIAIQHSLHEQPVVPRRSAHEAFTPRQQPLDPIPLIVSQSITTYAHMLKIKSFQQKASSELDDTP